MIQDFNIGDIVTAFVLLKQIEIKVAPSGSRLALVLGDRSGEIDGILWDNAEAITDELAGAEVVKVKGQVGSYRQKQQLTVEKIRPAARDEYNIEDLRRSSGKSVQELKDEYIDMVDALDNPSLKQLLVEFQNDAPTFELFLTKPAGKRFHHDYYTGLAQHSLSLASLADLICQNYPDLDRDLLVCGALFHDIGKIKEFAGEVVYDYSDAGRLIGHITMGDHYIAGLIDKIEDFPDDLALKLRHMILSHHGTGEHGAPVTPKTREAFVLHFIDEIDSKLDAIVKSRRKPQRNGLNLSDRWKPFFIWNSSLKKDLCELSFC